MSRSSSKRRLASYLGSILVAMAFGILPTASFGELYVFSSLTSDEQWTEDGYLHLFGYAGATSSEWEWVSVYVTLRSPAGWGLNTATNSNWQSASTETDAWIHYTDQQGDYDAFGFASGDVSGDHGCGLDIGPMSGRIFTYRLEGVNGDWADYTRCNSGDTCRTVQRRLPQITGHTGSFPLYQITQHVVFQTGFVVIFRVCFPVSSQMVETCVPDPLP